MTSRTELHRRLGHEFGDAGLLDVALTHRSHGTPHNERLEFLGDGVLNFLVAEDLYRRFPGAAEGILTRMRAGIVAKPSLARVARALELGPCLRLGGGELKNGGYDRDSILADALEAIIGAIYLDGGLEPCRRFVLGRFAEALAEVHPDEVVKDPKSRLQEYLHQHAREVPTYRVVEIHGEPHAQHFIVECELDDAAQRFRGEGSNRRSAEQEAAAKAYRALTQAHGG